jgi:UDP-GlcNAc3NAcA epimerase
MKIATIIGARPQFIKAAAVSRAISEFNKSVITKSSLINEVIVHSGQHYDRNMSDVFFEEMNIPRPDYFLDINGLSHGAMTGQMLEKIEEVLIKEEADIVMVYGDTNTTLAGALAAVKLHIPVAHVEAGLRSFNRQMPEEINRVLTDHVANWLFCPTKLAVRNLKAEGIGASSAVDKPIDSSSQAGVSYPVPKTKHVSTKDLPITVALVGDVMLDATMFYKKYACKAQFALPENYILATLHRAENTDNPSRLKSIFNGLYKISKELPIFLPLHPRTRKTLEALDLKMNRYTNITIIDPVSYLEMIYMLDKCTMVMTDSGGLQKEAFFFEKPCITLRDETEWVELVDNGLNYLAGADTENIIMSFKKALNAKLEFNKKLYGEGDAGSKIVNILSSN